MFNKIHRGILTLMLLTAGLVLGNASYAALAFPGPLNAPFTNPDIVGTVLNLVYDYQGSSPNNLLTIAETGSSTGTFKDSSNVSHTITGLDYALSAVLDEANNNQLLSGTLTIIGGIADLGIANGSTLLVATLTSLGTSWPADQTTTSGVFQFLGNITSSNILLGFGSSLVVTYGANGTLSPEFQSGDDFTGLGSADNSAPVPEPGTLLLLAAGGLALCGVRKQRPAPALTD